MRQLVFAFCTIAVALAISAPRTQTIAITAARSIRERPPTRRHMLSRRRRKHRSVLRTSLLQLRRQSQGLDESSVAVDALPHGQESHVLSDRCDFAATITTCRPQIGGPLTDRPCRR